MRKLIKKMLIKKNYYRLGPEGGYVPTSPRQRSIGVMMYLSYCTSRKKAGEWGNSRGPGF